MYLRPCAILMVWILNRFHFDRAPFFFRSENGVKSEWKRSARLIFANKKNRESRFTPFLKTEWSILTLLYPFLVLFLVTTPSYSLSIWRHWCNLHLLSTIFRENWCRSGHFIPKKITPTNHFLVNKTNVKVIDTYHLHYYISPSSNKPKCSQWFANHWDIYRQT